jgi:N-methylhydantoinase A/oxoprolinase/acetone carboxylase beta subunit
MSEQMNLSLGVDTGGTFTDAVVVNRTNGQILASAKSLTTKQDLFKGIFSAISLCIEDGADKFSREKISMVCLSTTLATNAITEGAGGSVCEILIGYNRELLKKEGFIEELAADEVVWVSGGHDFQGDEAQPLDELHALREIKRLKNSVEVFAVSGYFSIRNPEHELRVKELVSQVSDIPVTCAHELTSRLNSVSRAVTVGHNARLIPLLKYLITDIDRALNKLNISAPLMIVKGDGAVVPAQWAIQRPIETILSGPAASCVGAFNLTGNEDVWVLDMGGTTTDIASLKNGRPSIHPDGAFISHRRSMVEAVDIHTVGIGGDSLVQINSKGELTIGPCRAIPLCSQAMDHSGILSHLNNQVIQGQCENQAEQFLVAGRVPDTGLNDKDMDFIAQLQPKPIPIMFLSSDRRKYVSQKWIEQLEKRGCVYRSGFTPTDALHVLGQMSLWNRDASLKAATILGARLGMKPEAFCNHILKNLTKLLVRELVYKAMEPKAGLVKLKKGYVASVLSELALNKHSKNELDIKIGLQKPLVAIGAPVGAYMPAVASKLNTRLILPEYAHVANAFGAATAGVVQRARAVIRMLKGGLAFRVHLPEKIIDFPTLEEAKEHGYDHLKAFVINQARKAGADNIKVETAWKDPSGRLPLSPAQEVFLDTEIMITAYGEPMAAKNDRKTILQDHLEEKN